MKKEKEESPLKAARKKTREAIEIRLVKTLKTITAELKYDAFDSEKEAKRLAKKIIKGLKKSDDEAKPDTEAAKKTVKEASAKEKPVSPAPVAVKPVKPEAKTPVLKAAAPKAVKSAAPKSTKK